MRFATTLTTAPTVEPISLSEAKDYAKVEYNDDDQLIDSLITSARLYVENFIRRPLNTQTITMAIDWCFPEVIPLPMNPVQSITAASFTYVNSDGDVTQVPTATYTTDTLDPARIYLAYNQVWPTVRMQRKTISVVFVAGYGDAGTSIPEPIRTAIKMMVTYHYETRQPHMMGIGATMVTMPKTVETLLLPYVVLV